MTMLKAQCSLPMREPHKLLAVFCEHYTEHGRVRRRGESTGHVAMPYGSFAIHADETGLSVRARSVREDGLIYLKMGVVHHLKEFLGEDAPLVRWQGDGQAGGTPSFWREMRVVRAFDVTPSMRRVVLSGENLEAFGEGGIHVRLFFPPEGRALHGPVLGEDGCPVWPEGENKLTPRVYTIRELDLARSEVAIDILRHDGDTTPGSQFAANARAGQRVGMAGPLGDGQLPPCRRFVFLGDETAIPAIDRHLRRLPAGAEAHAVIEIARPGEEQALQSSAALRIEWLHRDSGARSLAEAAEAVCTKEDCYIWAGCEFTDFQAIRRHCRKVLAIPRDRHHVAAYWRKGAKGE